MSNINNLLFTAKLQGVSKKRNTFRLEYLKHSLTKFIVLLVCYLVLSYNSIEPSFNVAIV